MIIDYRHQKLTFRPIGHKGFTIVGRSLKQPKMMVYSIREKKKDVG